jgi:ADP-ribose pyrophosphatase YjhB (NUDIX family)
MLEQLIKKQRITSIPAVYLVLCRQSQANGKEIMMSLRSGTGYRDGFWSFPAGHLEDGESLHQAMVREAKEELDIKISASNLALAHSMWRATPEAQGGRLDFFFTAIAWTGEPRNAEPAKCGRVSWWPVTRLPSPLIPEVALAIESIEKGIPYSEVA